MKLTYNQIAELIQVFAEMSKKTKGHKLGFEINSNLANLRLKFNHIEKTVSDFVDTFKIKDAKGENKNFISIGGKITGEYDNKKELNDGESLVHKFDPERFSELIEERKKFEEEEHEINIHLLSREKVETAFENGKFDEVDLSPLFMYNILD